MKMRDKIQALDVAGIKKAFKKKVKTMTENHIILSEQALLAGIIIDNRNIEKAGLLSPADFYDSRHRAIFEKMKELHAAGQAIDLTSFACTEYEDYVLDPLMQLPEGLLNIEKYVEETKNASLRRLLISRLAEIQNANSDFIETKAKVAELARKLEQNTLVKFDFKRPSSIAAKKTSFFLDDFIPLPVGAVTMISSRGGSGKSALALQIALRAADRQIPTLAWLSEDPDYTTKYRLEKISGFTEIPICDNFLTIADQIPFQVLKKSDKQIGINPVFYEFKAACRGFKLIIIDPLIAFFGGNENDNGEARQFMDLLTDWTKRDNKSIVLIHHHSKFANIGDARGATAFVDAARAHYTIEADKSDNKNILIKIEKDNWGIKTFFKNEKYIQIFKENFEVKNAENEFAY
ncbi:MAG: AAA family ATPase [Deltaproteobacteria bacterium]|jgi:replicative DNA helicase|nr:AAA family ATPase [Deltaproteobacteria bacterium]MCL5880937.1 AAA family ATPase [Deltaproteobacteria bacterium]MDA8303595.1 AAA family ATPase [Deltaproteobacteria bacterium]